MYARFVGRYTGALAEALVDRAGVRQGDSALDVGCGPGAALETLARRVGAENVAGIDPSKPFVEMAMSRVPGRGRPAWRRRSAALRRSLV